MRNVSVRRWRVSIMITALVMFFVMPMLVAAQDYPTKPINLTVCIATGGTVDLSTRVLAHAG